MALWLTITFLVAASSALVALGLVAGLRLGKARAAREEREWYRAALRRRVD